MGANGASCCLPSESPKDSEPSNQPDEAPDWGGASTTCRCALYAGRCYGCRAPDKTAEHERLTQAHGNDAPWRRWGPNLSERQWGTVREDGNACQSFTHDQARSRAYRRGEDGIEACPREAVCALRCYRVFQPDDAGMAASHQTSRTRIVADMIRLRHGATQNLARYYARSSVQ
jgi:hypothetical protein